MLFRTVPSSTPYGLLFPIGSLGFAKPPKTSIAIILGTGRAVKIGGMPIYIHRVYPNSKIKNIKNFGEKGAWAYPGTAQRFKVPHIIPGTGKATNFRFCKHIYIYRSIGTKAHYFGKAAVGVARDSQIF